MILFGIGPREVRAYKNKVGRRIRKLNVVFALAALLPFIVYGLFAIDILKAKPRFNRDIEIPVAMVQTAQGIGSAFLYGERELLTAKHVIEGMQVGDQVTLVFQNANPVISTQARISWIDPNNSPETDPNHYLHDVAKLELVQPTDLPEDFPRLLLGDSDGITSRTSVILVGYPAGSPSTTTGTISSEDVQGVDLFQLDVSAYPGNSGGPLILEDTEEVIGILIAGKSGQFQGINFAIKVNSVQQ